MRHNLPQFLISRINRQDCWYRPAIRLLVTKNASLRSPIILRLLLLGCLMLAIGTSHARATAVSSHSHNEIPLSISAKQPWTATGVYLSTGERFAVSARGSARWRPNHKPVSPAGLPFQYFVCASAQYSGHVFTAPGVQCWSLIARIGPNKVPFLVGRNIRLRSPTTGELYLGFNDDVYSDNGGYFEAQVSAAGSS